MSHYLSILDHKQLQYLLNQREGEVKLGEKVKLISSSNSWQAEVADSDAIFVLLGIPEDIGVRANNGVGGAHTAWLPTLQSLVNIQSLKKFTGEELLILGSFDFADLMQQSNEMSLEQMRELVTQIDNEVYPIIQAIIASGKIPIIIGGGHNNAYPLLKGASFAFQHAINCINLDAHSDFRIMEGRHSGNGFRYAHHEGYLNQYAIVGLHENYNSQSIIRDLDNNANIQYSFYEDIFLRNELDFDQAVLQAINFTDGLPTGIELDLDSIQNVLSSAVTPVGINTLQARQFVHLVADKANPAYLHLTEGATKLASGMENRSVGKLIAYLISDFIKAVNFTNQL